MYYVTFVTLGNFFSFWNERLTKIARKIKTAAIRENPIFSPISSLSIIIIKELKAPCKRIARINPRIKNFPFPVKK